MLPTVIVCVGVNIHMTKKQGNDIRKYAKTPAHVKYKKQLINFASSFYLYNYNLGLWYDTI